MKKNFKKKSNKYFLNLFLAISFSALIIFPTKAESNFNVKEIVWNGNNVLVIKIPPNLNILPAASLPGHSVKDWAKIEGGIAAINGGYFNHSDGWPVSKVLVNGVSKTEPE
jgi:exopolysaccharide biosynthesis protein